MKTPTCQATQSHPVEVEVPSQSPDGPYKLCKEAADRLHSRTLRPLEWFRLAVIHSPWEYHLQDDFYDNDGSATCPNGPVVDAALFPIPALSEVSHDPDMLLEYIITRWFLGQAELDAMQDTDPQVLAEAIKTRRRTTENSYIISRLHEISGSVLGTSMDQWVRTEYSLLRTSEDRLCMLSLSGACLPRADARQLTVDELATLSGKTLVDNILVLSPFRNESTLDWIEANICGPLTGQWGDLAALADFSWKRADKWLGMGRPLSLIALDALVACDSPRPNQSALLQEAAPKLLDSPGENIIEQCLVRCLKNDPTPRVRKAVNRIVASLDNIQGTRNNVNDAG